MLLLFREVELTRYLEKEIPLHLRCSTVKKNWIILEMTFSCILTRFNNPHRLRELRDPLNSISRQRTNYSRGIWRKKEDRGKERQKNISGVEENK